MALRDQFLALRDRFWPCKINFWFCEIVFGLARSIFGLARRPMVLLEDPLPCSSDLKIFGNAASNFRSQNNYGNTIHTYHFFRFLSYQEWVWDLPFPSYCNGWLYALKPYVAKQLVAASRHSPFIFIDDLYITGILRHR